MDGPEGFEMLGKGPVGIEWRCTNANGTYRADDLIPEESETVQLALKRLSPKEAYDRVFRMRRAFQVHIPHRME